MISERSEDIYSTLTRDLTKARLHFVSLSFFGNSLTVFYFNLRHFSTKNKIKENLRGAEVPHTPQAWLFLPVCRIAVHHDSASRPQGKKKGFLSVLVPSYFIENPTLSQGTAKAIILGYGERRKPLENPNLSATTRWGLPKRIASTMTLKHTRIH